MEQSYVFPGGVADETDPSSKHTAIREVYEECGVLLADWNTEQEFSLPPRNGEMFTVLSQAGIQCSLDAMHFFAHWITPSIESRRYSAQFYVAAMPAGQAVMIDGEEIVDSKWLSPKDALARSGELRLPPPQIRSLWEIESCASFEDVVKLCAKRDGAAPILPKACPNGERIVLALPWDVDYETAPGEGQLLSTSHPQAHGPSRFEMTDNGWRHC